MNQPDLLDKHRRTRHKQSSHDNPLLSRELRIWVSQGGPSKISLRPGQHAYKTRSTWWSLMDERKGVEGTNAARDKPMSPDSSTQTEHAAWQNCGDVLLSAQLTHAALVHPAPVRSTAQESEIYGVFQLVFDKVQYANPGLACTPD